MRFLTIISAGLHLGLSLALQYDYAGGTLIDQQTLRAVNEKRVAIIGAGAGGSSAAFHLAQYAEGAGIRANISVFERSSHVGGRSTTVNAYGDPTEPVELGASIFVKVNRILVSAAERFNLTATTRIDGPSAAPVDGPFLGIWNGKQFVFVQSSSEGWWDTAKLLWRYGWAPVRTMGLMKAVVGKFLHMYEEPHFPWRSLSRVAYELGLTNVTAVTGEQYLQENGVSALFANEIVAASTRVNYAQNLPYIHGLETMVCMATDGAMAVTGGNWQIFDNMLRAADATVRLDTRVSGLDKLDDGTWRVHFKERSGNAWSSSTTAEEFDSVIMAGPYQFSDITINPPASRGPDAVPYVKLHVTLFASPHLLSPQAFNLPANTPVPRIVLTALASDERPGSEDKSVGSPGFFSISNLRGVNRPREGYSQGHTEYLYKIFSAEAPNSTFLAHILGLPNSEAFKGRADGSPDSDDKLEGISSDDIPWIHRKVWNSYPYEFPRVTFESLRLDHDLWYTGGMDSFISTMETNALMGKNVARLIADGWAGHVSDGAEWEWNADEHGKLMPHSKGIRVPNMNVEL